MGSVGAEIACYRLRVGQTMVSNPGRGKRLFSKRFRPAVGPTQSPLQWLLKALSPGIKWPGHEANHFHVMPRLMGGTIRLLPILCGHGVYRGNF